MKGFVVPLGSKESLSSQIVGTKASNLASMTGKEIPVPPGFCMGLAVRLSALKQGFNRWRIHRALIKVRSRMAKDVPEIFSGTVEIDETYICGKWKNKRKKHRQIKAKRGRVTLKTPVFGILCRGGKVWAEVVSDVEARTLIPLIDKRVRCGSIICSDTWKGYTGIAAEGISIVLLSIAKENTATIRELP